MLTGIDAIPTPNAHVGDSHPIFPTQPEQQASRRSLELLDRSLAKSQGKSDLIQVAMKKLRPCLDKNVITDLYGLRRDLH